MPVENIDLLSRYGSDNISVQLDRLGGGGWQTRKAKIKQQVRDIAEKLIQIAALRELKQAPLLTVPDDLYDEFCARFPLRRRKISLSSIEAVINDLGRGRPADRLICGDVGFGKTEVALRASFIAAMNSKQVAVVAQQRSLPGNIIKHFQNVLWVCQ